MRRRSTLAPIPEAPSADPKSKEEKRFARADKDDDGRITLAELVEPRRKAFAKLDLNRDGKLSFEEWAVKTIDKFDDADADKSKAADRRRICDHRAQAEAEAGVQLRLGGGKKGEAAPGRSLSVELALGG